MSIKKEPKTGVSAALGQILRFHLPYRSRRFPSQNFGSLSAPQRSPEADLAAGVASSHLHVTNY